MRESERAVAQEERQRLRVSERAVRRRECGRGKKVNDIVRYEKREI